ncbi:MAG: cell division protein FtsI, partial [Lachnospiraceae bacterium]|nr:cell division protein FtsI [Lachnospiraceae bacterium]
MQKKLVVLFIIVLLAFVGLSLRLIYINRDNGERYKKQVLEQQEYTSKTLAARRGDIFDANGNPLAVSEKIYNLIIDAKVINDKEDYFEPTMNALDRFFDLDMNEIRKHVKENPRSAYYIATKGLTYAQVEDYFNFMNDEEASKNVKGIWFEENYKRNYPNGTLACDVIGFTNADNNGSYGLEEYYDEILNGTPGREYGYLNEDENLERTTKPATDGYSLITTIDATIQSIV